MLTMDQLVHVILAIDKQKHCTIVKLVRKFKGIRLQV